jgi:hypothetical protein
MVGVLALSFAGGAFAYWAVQRIRSGGQGTAPPIGIENANARSSPKTNPLQRFIEIAGVRLDQNPQSKKMQAKFLVINHSGAEISDLAANATVWGRTNKSEEEPVGTFAFKVPTLGPWEAKEVTTPLDTKLKVYEMPDWQNVTTDVQITSPQSQ